jgi:hypothetical protein
MQSARRFKDTADLKASALQKAERNNCNLDNP